MLGDADHLVGFKIHSRVVLSFLSQTFSKMSNKIKKTFNLVLNHSQKFPPLTSHNTPHSDIKIMYEHVCIFNIECEIKMEIMIIMMNIHIYEII